MARRTSKLGLIFLSIYLILTGLIHLIHLSFSGLDVLIGIVAIVAGALLLFAYR